MPIYTNPFIFDKQSNHGAVKCITLSLLIGIIKVWFVIPSLEGLLPRGH